MIKCIWVCCLAWALAAHVLPAKTPADARRRVDTLGPDGWSHSTLENGRRVVTLGGGEAFRVDSLSPVTEEEARKLGYPGFEDTPPSGRNAHDEDALPLSKRLVRERYYLGSVSATCAVSGIIRRPTAVRVKLDTEQRKLDVFTPRKWIGRWLPQWSI